MGFKIGAVVGGRVIGIDAIRTFGCTEIECAVPTGGFVVGFFGGKRDAQGQDAIGVRSHNGLYKKSHKTQDNYVGANVGAGFKPARFVHIGHRQGCFQIHNARLLRIADAVDETGLVVRYQQRTVGHDEYIDGSSPVRFAL